ncbi:MAG: uracil phosphoribosyltransferase, partial [Acidimicrobiales bacterium]
MQVTVVDHPLAAQLLTRLRDESTERALFRRAMDDLSGILVYEATRDVEAEIFEVRTPLGPATGTRVARPPLVVPVLRAGLGMLGGVLRYLPETDTGFIGLARNEETYLPESYMSSVPDQLEGRPVLVLDPMLATGGSLEHACRTLAERGAGPLIAVCVLAAPEGIARIEG